MKHERENIWVKTQFLYLQDSVRYMESGLTIRVRLEVFKMCYNDTLKIEWKEKVRSFDVL